MRRLCSLAAVAALAVPGTALAQDPVPVPPPPTQTAPPPPPPAPPPPAPAGGKFKIRAERVGGKQAAVLAGQAWRVRGIVAPYVAGQKAIVRFYIHNHKIKARQASVLKSKSGAAGYFLVRFKTTRTGRITIRATKPGTAEQATLKATPKHVTVLPLRAGPGARGPAVRLLQQQLAALGYVTGVPGFYDDRTARAVMAFRKITDLPRNFVADANVFRKLAHGAGRFHVRFASHGHHVEANLGKQVLALIDHGRVQRIYPISSGKPSTPTVVGSFRVYTKSPGYNAKGMFYSNYFIRGYAIHGYAEVPPFAASHGCLRVPIPDAIPIYNWVRIGDQVDVYY